jgi:ATP-dependent Lon protease
VKNQLEIVPVKWFDQVLAVALESMPEALPDEEPAKVEEKPAVAAEPAAAGDLLKH